MEPQRTTAKDFFINLGAIVALYTVVFNLINLLFTVINKAYPQIQNYNYYYNPSASISFPVATIIIFFPIFILLSWLMNKDFVTSPEKKNLGIHKWLAYITLFLTGLAFAGDLVSVLYFYLDGQELTAGFLMKALVVLVISGLLFFYYISDIRRTLSPKERVVWRLIALVLVAGSIIWGFSVLGSPHTQQLIKYDEQKTNDLQNINSQIQNYYYEKGALPTAMTDLSNGNNYFMLPVDAQTKQPYEYKKKDEKTYEICATFNKEAKNNQTMESYPTMMYGMNTWTHPAGHYCFEQTVNSDNIYGKPVPAR